MNSLPPGQPGDGDTRLAPNQQMASKHKQTKVLALLVPTRCSVKFPLWEPQVTRGKDRSSPSSLKRVPVYFPPQWEGQAGKAIVTQLRKALVVGQSQPPT